MTQVRRKRHQRGAAFVEAAIVMPALLLTTFCTMFLCLLGYRLTCVQMAANDVARSISNAFNGGAYGGCSGGIATNVTNGTIEIQTLRNNCMTSWRGTIATRYLIPASNSMTIEVSGYAHQGSHDGGGTIPDATTLRGGDSFVVVVSFPKTNILGGKVPLHGLLSGNLVGSAAGFIERPQRL